MTADIRQHRRRIALGSGANAISKAWIVIAQLVTVPVLTHTWGLEHYGLWLMVSALPTYVLLSDFGFGSSATVAVAEAYAINDHDEVNAVLQSIWLLTCAIGAVLLFLTLIVWLLRHDIYPLLPIALADDDVFGSGALLIVSALAIVQMTVLLSIFRGTGHFAFGALMIDITFPIGTLALVVIAASGGGMLLASIALLILRAASLPVYYNLLKSRLPHVKLGFRKARLDIIRRLFVPSIANLTFNLAQAFAIQGLIITIGITLGPAMAGVFGLAKTLVRLPLQIISIVTRAITPEITLASVTGQKGRMHKLMAVALIGALGFSLVAAVCMTLAGPWAISLISNGKVTAPHILFFALTLAMSAEAIWTTAIQCMMALNAHARITPYYLVIAGLIAVSPLTVHTSVGVAFTGAALEAVMLAITTIGFLRVFRPKLSTLTLSKWPFMLKLFSIRK